MTNPSRDIDIKTTLALSFSGVLLGILLSASVLSGDSQGRVNLLFLLLLFAFLPLLTLILSLLLASAKKNGLTAVILNSPFWPKVMTLDRLQFDAGRQRRFWLFYQSQVLSLAFGLGSILVFLALLLGTDVNFVWRSTLLEATDLLPVLTLIASPWFFWTDAQPSLELLEQSQNSRILGQISAYSENWWQFVLAAQLTYSLVPRAILLGIARWQYRTSIQNQYQTNTEFPSNESLKTSSLPELAAVVYTLPGSYHLLDWNGAPDHCTNFIIKSFGKPAQQNPLHPLSPASIVSKPDQLFSTVVLVKSWDAPLGELSDVLMTIDNHTTNYILPMDWDESSITPPKLTHLEEWQRFAATLTNWEVLQPGEHS